MDAAPFPDLLTKEVEGAKGVYGEQLYRLPEPPVDWRDHLPGIILLRGASELHRTSLKSFWPFRSSHLDSADVSLAQEDHRLRVPDQAEESRFYPSGSFEKINILETSLSVWFIDIWRPIAASY